MYRLNAEIGYWLGEEHWGKGIMTNVIRSIIKYIFENFDIKRIYAMPFATSIGSVKTLEKAGFTKEATIHKGVIKNGKCWTITFIQLLLSNELPRPGKTGKKSFKILFNFNNYYAAVAHWQSISFPS